MRCNWCHEIIPVGEELREQGGGYSYSIEGTGEGSYTEGGYYHIECWKAKQEKQNQKPKYMKIVAWIVLVINVGIIIYLLANFNNKQERLTRWFLIPSVIGVGGIIYYIITGNTIYDLIKGSSNNKRPKITIQKPKEVIKEKEPSAKLQENKQNQKKNNKKAKKKRKKN